LEEKIKSEEKKLQRIEKEEEYIQQYMDSMVRKYHHSLLSSTLPEKIKKWKK
jgi:uncharacterized protein (DUF3084 family)